MSLNHLTPEQVREIAARYQLQVTGETGNRPECTSFFWLCMFGIVPALSLLFFLIFFWALGVDLSAGLMAISVLGGSILVDWAAFFTLFLVSVPKLGVALVLNRLNGVMHICTPGWNIVYPWEEYYWATDDLSQRAGTVRKTSTFLTKDGVSVSFSWTVQEGPFLPLLPLNIRYNEEDVAGSVTEIVENTISEEILELSAAEIMSGHEAIDTLEAKLLDAMQGEPPSYRDRFNSSIEERVGSNMEIATLGPPTYADEYKEALVTSKTVEIMKAAALTLTDKNGLGLEGGQAMDTVLILNKENVKKDIFKIEADDNTKALAGAIGGILRTVDRTTSRLPRRGRGGGGSSKPGGTP